MLRESRALERILSPALIGLLLAGHLRGEGPVRSGTTHPQIWCDKGSAIASVSTSNRGRSHARRLRRASRAGMRGIQRKLQALDPVNWRLENGGGAGSRGPARKAVLWQAWREAMTSGVSNGTRDGSPTRKLRAPAAARRR